MLRIDPTRREARWHDRPLALNERAFDLLALLARHAGEVVPQQRLNRALWPGRHVDPSNLRLLVGALRRALGADALRTVPGRGYVLAVPVVPLPVAAAAAAGALPLVPGPLFGREADAAALDTLLREHRLVSVLGPGGIGKTRVALAHAHAAACAGHRVAWVDLAPLPAAEASTARLCRAIAEGAALQLPGAADGRHLGQVIGQAGGDRETLLVLDNAEHVAAPLADVLPGLLAGAPALRVLVTSQHALALPFGQAWWLPSLAVPDPQADAAGVQASPAVRLVLRRARDLQPGWQPAPADWPLLGRIARALEGLPLALELAAGRLPLLGARELLAHLAEHLQAPAGAAPAGPARHRTLGAALDWSHALLSPAERAALLPLALFTGPFRLAAAMQVVQAGTPADAQALLDALVAHSMLQWLPAGAHDAPVRLRMSETTRLHTLQAADAAALHTAEARHGRAMALLAREAGADFLAASDDAWTARWLPEHDDWQLAFDRAATRGDAEVAADLIEVLVLGANITGRLEPVMQRWQATRALAAQAPPAARARLLGWGQAAAQPGTDRRAQTAQRVQAWQALQGEDAHRSLCVAWAMHAVVCQDCGDAAGADAALEACLALESPAWPPRLRRRCSWIALTRLAVARDDAALLARARRLSVRIGAELQAQGAWRELTLVQLQQARMLRLGGRFAAAAALLADAAATQLRLGCTIDAGRSLGLRAAALAEQADARDTRPPRAALAAAAQALQLSAPHPAQVLHFAEALALLAARGGQAELAAQLLAGAAALRQAQQALPDALAGRAAAAAWRHVRGALDEPTLQRCAQQGGGLDAEGWRQAALHGLVALGYPAT